MGKAAEDINADVLANSSHSLLENVSGFCKELSIIQPVVRHFSQGPAQRASEENSQDYVNPYSYYSSTIFQIKL